MFKGIKCPSCTDTDKKDRGCTEKLKDPWVLGGEEFFYCPVKCVTPQTWMYIRLYTHYRNNMLYKTGGLGIQPCKYLAAMECLAVIYQEVQEEDARNRRNR